MGSAVTLAKRLTPPAGKQVARRLLRGYGTVTAGARPLPDYLIIGTKRGGTTSLWKNLIEHPQVQPMFPAAENLKSPHFFDLHYHRGERWYRSHFPTRRGRAAGPDDGRRSVIGEASPYYVFHPLAPDRVAATVPDVRLIVLLRNPTERAYSHYQERCKEGTEWLPFAEAIAAEPDRLAGQEEAIRRAPRRPNHAHDFYSYLARGRYLEHLEPWLGRFPPAQLLIVRSEDMYADPAATLSHVHRFLGLEPHRPQRLQHHNRLTAPQLPGESRRWLDDYYRPHVAALERRLGRTFDWPI